MERIACVYCTYTASRRDALGCTMFIPSDQEISQKMSECLCQTTFTKYLTNYPQILEHVWLGESGQTSREFKGLVVLQFDLSSHCFCTKTSYCGFSRVILKPLMLLCEGWKHNKQLQEVQIFISRYNKVWTNITTDNRPAPLQGLLWQLVLSRIISPQHTYIAFCAGLFYRFLHL